MTTRQCAAGLFLVLPLIGTYLSFSGYIQLATSKKYSSRRQTIATRQWGTSDIYTQPIEHYSYKSANKDWKLQESLELGDLVQRRLGYLQNPKDCKKAKKLICSYESTCNSGFGCLLHFMTDCMIMAYATGRTLIVDNAGWKYKQVAWEDFFQPFSNNCTEYEKADSQLWTPGKNIDSVTALIIKKLHVRNPRPDFLPLAVPEDLSDRIQRFHGYPAVWWAGQILKFVTRPKEDFMKILKESEETLVFQKPIVGVHIRRSDKVTVGEAKYHSLGEYMQQVEKWFNTYEERHPGIERRVYLATDTPAVLEEARQTYANYTFISDKDTAISAAKPNRFNGTALSGIISDLHFLSLCDFLVVTFSSNVGRVAYMLMQTMHGDASQYAKSIDYNFHFSPNGKYTRNLTAIESHGHVNQKNELEFLPGDIIKLAWGTRGVDYWSGKNYRTGKTGFFPYNKTKDAVFRAKMPTYQDV